MSFPPHVIYADGWYFNNIVPVILLTFIFRHFSLLMTFSLGNNLSLSGLEKVAESPNNATFTCYIFFKLRKLLNGDQYLGIARKIEV